MCIGVYINRQVEIFKPASNTAKNKNAKCECVGNVRFCVAKFWSQKTLILWRRKKLTIWSPNFDQCDIVNAWQEIVGRDKTINKCFLEKSLRECQSHLKQTLFEGFNLKIMFNRLRMQQLERVMDWALSWFLINKTNCRCIISTSEITDGFDQI